MARIARSVFAVAAGEPPPSVRAALDELASFTTYLGHSSSLVRLAFAAADAEATFRPDSTGTINLRVPRAGRLQVLDQRFAQGQPVDTGHFERYAAVDTNVSLQAASSIFDEMLVVRCERMLGAAHCDDQSHRHLA